LIVILLRVSALSRSQVLDVSDERRNASLTENLIIFSPHAVTDEHPGNPRRTMMRSKATTHNKRQKLRTNF
jgi:hypothetical protein